MWCCLPKLYTDILFPPHTKFVHHLVSNREGILQHPSDVWANALEQWNTRRFANCVLSKTSLNNIVRCFFFVVVLAGKLQVQSTPVLERIGTATRKILVVAVF